jgi:hypothetical protein
MAAGSPFADLWLTAIRNQAAPDTAAPLIPRDGRKAVTKYAVQRRSLMTPRTATQSQRDRPDAGGH